MSITKGTIIRTIMMVIVIINLVLEKCGIDIINVDESSVGMFVEMTVEIAAIAASWWYNNSLTENAKKADEFLESLNATAD
jgi:SPP1 family holin